MAVASNGGRLHLQVTFELDIDDTWLWTSLSVASIRDLAMDDTPIAKAMEWLQSAVNPGCRVPQYMADEDVESDDGNIKPETGCIAPVRSRKRMRRAESKPDVDTRKHVPWRRPGGDSRVRQVWQHERSQPNTSTQLTRSMHSAKPTDDLTVTIGMHVDVGRDTKWANRHIGARRAYWYAENDQETLQRVRQSEVGCTNAKKKLVLSASRKRHNKTFHWRSPMLDPFGGAPGGLGYCGTISRPEADEVAWARRIAHRQAGIDCVRGGPVYAAYRAANSVVDDGSSALRVHTPDPCARGMTKRVWERAALYWRACLRQAVEPQPSDHGFRQVCLVDSLRNLGVDLPYVGHGPFRAVADGDLMLLPFRQRLDLVDLTVPLPPGRYVFWSNGHFTACHMGEGSCRCIDGHHVVPFNSPMLAWRLVRTDEEFEIRTVAGDPLGGMDGSGEMSVPMDEEVLHEALMAEVAAHSDGNNPSPMLDHARPEEGGRARSSTDAFGSDSVADGSSGSSSWEMWDGPLLKKLRTQGDGLENLVIELEQGPGDVITQMTAIGEAIKARHPQWNTYSEDVQRAVLLIEFGETSVPQDWNSMLFMTKCVILVAQHLVRSHESGLYELEHSCWSSEIQFSVRLIDLLEKACKLAAGLLLAYVNTIQEAYEHGTLSVKLAEVVLGPQALQKARTSLMQRPAQEQPEGPKSGKWSAATGYALLRWVPKWSNNVSIISKAFVIWASRPRPSGNGAIAFTDCVVKLEDKAVNQILRKDAVDVYCKIPVPLGVEAPDHFQEWFRKFFVTCVAGRSVCSMVWNVGDALRWMVAVKNPGTMSVVVGLDESVCG